jgi:large subunit ribosomal protein L29
MKANEIREMGDDALFAKGAEIREALFRLRFKQALGNTDTVRQLQTARKDLARIKTEVRAREVKAAMEAGTYPGRHTSRAERTRKSLIAARKAARS